MSLVDDAVDAVAEAIATSASAEQRPEGLKLLAEAAAQLKFGPSGSSTDYRYTQNITQDVHTTSHEGEKRSRPPAGYVGIGPGQH